MSDEIKRLDNLAKEIDKQISDLYDMSTVLRSVKVLLNYKETGKPYGDEEVYL